MLVNAIKCNNCGDTIYSRARHDFRECSCQGCFVDGGFDYFRYGGDNFAIKTVKVNVTKKVLYDDWNEYKDKYGKIRAD